MIYRFFTRRSGVSGFRALLVALILSGCAGHNSGPHPKKGPPYQYAQMDLDELLSFGSELAEMSEEKVADICREMRWREIVPEVAGGGLVLHQMLGQLRSQECADLDSLVARLNGLPLERLPDFRTRQLVIMQAAILRRQHAKSAAPVNSKPDTAKGRPKSHSKSKHSPKSGSAAPVKPEPAMARTKTSIKPKHSPHPAPPPPRRAVPTKTKTPEPVDSSPASKPAKSGDDLLLKQKLEAIRAMEQQMDAAEGVR